MSAEPQVSLPPAAADRGPARPPPILRDAEELGAASLPVPVPEDMVLVMADFAQAAGAAGWALICSAEPSPPLCLAAAGLADGQVQALLRVADRLQSASGAAAAGQFWVDRFHAAYRGDALLIPLPPSATDDAGMLVALVFTNTDPATRRRIGETARHRWPIAAAALRLWQSARIERRRAQGIEAGLNLVAIGIVLLSDDGRIVFANDAARALMTRHDGIRDYRGRLQATNRADMAALSHAISYALAECESQERSHRVPLLTLKRLDGPPLVASFVSAPGLPGAGLDPGALVFFVDPSLDIHQLAEPVCKLFRLSRVETELACLLASGQTLADAAQSLHVKPSTARGYLKQVFAKTGINRQVDLIRLIFSNVVRTSSGARPQRPG